MTDPINNMSFMLSSVVLYKVILKLYQIYNLLCGNRKKENDMKFISKHLAYII